MYVRGWVAGREFAEGVILFLHPATSDFSYRNSFHIICRLFLFLAPTRRANARAKVEDYRKSGKTKLITPGISTSQR